MRLLDHGYVTAIYPDRATVRVKFEDKGSDDIVSRELSMLVRGVQKDKDIWYPDIGELVLCAFLEGTSKRGYVLGSAYNDEDIPPTNVKTKRHLQFKDGSYIEYDEKTKKMTINLHPAGELIVNGTIKADAFVTT
ncbi:phage baseplate assembly protein V [Exiguobacterium sp. s130]|uniref:phage baseplate assembly protein V n=1 Tax=Exiguobacterium sp. s130 TaxID=2751190 RepID=UPI001BE6F570|nr:phage baseplate assembly protein V [Exiguobacterium sp. s130]